MNQFGDILLRTTEKGTQVRLRDVASVELGNQNYGASSRFGDKPTTIISIYQEPNSNAVALGEAVKAKMAELAERMPDGVKYEYDEVLVPEVAKGIIIDAIMRTKYTESAEIALAFGREKDAAKLAEHEAFLNRYMNMRKQNAELMRIIAQYEQINEEEKKDQT